MRMDSKINTRKSRKTSFHSIWFPFRAIADIYIVRQQRQRHHQDLRRGRGEEQTDSLAFNLYSLYSVVFLSSPVIMSASSGSDSPLAPSPFIIYTALTGPSTDGDSLFSTYSTYIRFLL